MELINNHSITWKYKETTENTNSNNVESIFFESLSDTLPMENDN